MAEPVETFSSSYHSSGCDDGSSIGGREAIFTTFPQHTIHHDQAAGVLSSGFSVLVSSTAKHEKPSPLFKAWLLFVRWPQIEAPSCFLLLQPSNPS
ncbi:unnamed protein product [Linum trigynum]|uniref:Uncharacterized protein n=1 Tax=Linum trigynum TaxID=586398 RepID=A0AAV2CCA8_9ROSI